MIGKISRKEAFQILDDLKLAAFTNCFYNLKKPKEESDRLAQRFYNHCVIVAEVAEKIAKQIYQDSEKAFVLGLLHDLGRVNPKRFHGLVGYELAMEKGWVDLARISLTHSFINDTIEEFHFPNNEFKEADIKKTKELFFKSKLDDFDCMVKMGDSISVGDTLFPVRIEERLNDINNRYPMSADSFKKLENIMFTLKSYWDKKLGMDLYVLLNI